MPFITISRMYGSGGSEVAQRVARALGWDLLDSAFVDAAAERLGIAPAVVAALDERTPAFGTRLIEALTLSSPESLLGSEARPTTEEDIVAVTERIIRERVAGGNAVLVGRGAQSVLFERHDVLHIFCYAPRAALIARTMTRLGVAEPEAAQVVDSTNRQRDQYVRRYWKRDWRDFTNYHLCLNTDWLGLDGAADLVVRLARERLATPPDPGDWPAATEPGLGAQPNWRNSGCFANARAQ